jgi:hypothetical protein
MNKGLYILIIVHFISFGILCYAVGFVTALLGIIIGFLVSVAILWIVSLISPNIFN